MSLRADKLDLKMKECALSLGVLLGQSPSLPLDLTLRPSEFVQQREPCAEFSQHEKPLR